MKHIKGRKLLEIPTVVIQYIIEKDATKVMIIGLIGEDNVPPHVGYVFHLLLHIRVHVVIIIKMVVTANTIRRT